LLGDFLREGGFLQEKNSLPLQGLSRVFLQLPIGSVLKEGSDLLIVVGRVQNHGYIAFVSRKDGECLVGFQGPKAPPLRGYVPPRRLVQLNGLHGVISQKTILFITTAVKTSNPTWMICVLEKIEIWGFLCSD
jgi:hypothetical protein